MDFAGKKAKCEFNEGAPMGGLKFQGGCQVFARGPLCAGGEKIRSVKIDTLRQGEAKCVLLNWRQARAACCDMFKRGYSAA